MGQENLIRRLSSAINRLSREDAKFFEDVSRRIAEEETQISYVLSLLSESSGPTYAGLVPRKSTPYKM